MKTILEMTCNMTELEKEVLGLQKTLEPIAEEDLQWYGQNCTWYDWDCNCHYADALTIGRVLGRFQIYEHYDVEMENRDARVVVDDPSTWESWITEDMVQESINDGCNYEEDGKEVTDVYYEDVEVIPMSQHWIDTTTGEVVFLGRPYKDDDGNLMKNCYGTLAVEADSHYTPFEVVPKGSPWFNRFNDDYGNLHHIDLDVHPVLQARGIIPMNTLDLDPEYDQSKFNDWYTAIPWHERVMSYDLCTRENEEYAEEKRFKIGGMNLLRQCLITPKNAEEYETAYKIRLRSHYTPQDEELWWEWIDLAISHGLDIHNAHYVCPDDVQARIDRYRYRRRVQDVNEDMENIEEMEKSEYKQFGEREEQEFIECGKQRYLKVSFDYKGVHYRVLQDVKEYLEEGLAMHHCVYRCKYFSKRDTLILSSTIDGKRAETIELDLKTGKVLQSYGIHDTHTPLHEMIVEGMEKNAELYTSLYKAG